MGTRGYWAIIYKGKMYVMYNHFDSYPQRPGLGWNLIQDIAWGNLETWKLALANIQVADGKPTDEDKSNLHPYTDLQVGSNSSNDWYCLTRKCQGSVERTLRSGVLLDDPSPFNENDLARRLGAQEWGYAIDLDKNEFRTFAKMEIHFWRFPLDAIPDGTFGEVSIRAFNRISDGGEFDYHESGDAIVQAYARYLEEEKGKFVKENEEKKQKRKKEAKDSEEEKFKASIDDLRKNIEEHETRYFVLCCEREKSIQESCEREKSIQEKMRLYEEKLRIIEEAIQEKVRQTEEVKGDIEKGQKRAKQVKTEVTQDGDQKSKKAKVLEQTKEKEKN